MRISVLGSLIAACASTAAPCQTGSPSWAGSYGVGQPASSGLGLGSGSFHYRWGRRAMPLAPVVVAPPAVFDAAVRHPHVTTGIAAPEAAQPAGVRLDTRIADHFVKRSGQRNGTRLGSGPDDDATIPSLDPRDRVDQKRDTYDRPE